MAGSLLANLTSAGVIERAGRGRAVLRVTPRFMAHVERTAAMRHLARSDALELALATWSDPTPGGAASIVASLLEEAGSALFGPSVGRCIAA